MSNIQPGLLHISYCHCLADKIGHTIRNCAIITWMVGVGKWVKYGSKLSRTPTPLTKPPHLLIILKSTPPPPPPPPGLPVTIGSHVPNSRVGCLPQARKITSNDNRNIEMQKLGNHKNNWQTANGLTCYHKFNTDTLHFIKTPGSKHLELIFSHFNCSVLNI